MTLARVVAPEALDGLAEDDPAARRARRDLRRVHFAMGSRRIVSRGLLGLQATNRPKSAGRPLRILELGAGDGSLLLDVARHAGRAWAPVELTLLDRQNLVDAPTLAAYGECGWTATALVTDVLDWIAGDRSGSPTPSADRGWDVVVANLFLHHFEAPPLRALLVRVAACADAFFACEPRRARLALAASHLVGAIGANAVTRQDAVLSVHAGFTGGELGALWPASAPGWTLAEYPAGAFSHCFRAERRAPPVAGSRRCEPTSTR